MKHFISTMCALLLLCLSGSVFAQRSGQFALAQACGGNDTYVNYFVAQVDRCFDVIDVSIELSGDLIEQIKKENCDIATIDIIRRTDGQQVITIGRNSDPSASFFGLPKSAEYIEFTLQGNDRMGNPVFSRPFSFRPKKPENVVVSESTMRQIFNMGHVYSGPPSGPTVGPNGDVFTYFCGRRMNMVTLLAFYQDFLGLSEYQICRLIEIFEEYNLQYTSVQNIELLGIYCDLLVEFWDDYVQSQDDGGGNGDDECECNVISTGAFVNHSIGEATGRPLEDCPDVSLTEGNKVWSHEGTLPNTNSDNNWLVSKWGYMGAAKSLYTISHHYESGDGERKMSYQLPMGVLKSSLTFGLKCVEPRNAAISTDCECEKTITAAAQYNSVISGQAGTDGNIISSGNGSVNSCMEDFAFFTRFSREGFEIIGSGATVSCVQCESTDSTNFLTDLGQIASGIEDIVPTVIDTSGFSISNIDDIILGAGSIINLVDNFLQNLETCGEYLDTTYVLLNNAETFTLSPANDFVSYIITSRAYTRTAFTNDEAWSELHLMSNYYLAAGLESDGDSTCCNELVGAYTIGDLGEFTESQLATVSGSDVDFEGYEFKINDPKKNGSWLEDGGLYQHSLITLEHLQVDVALLFAAINPNFLMDVFGIDCGPGCTTGMDCYYNCGFWGECHEDDGAGLVAAFSDRDELHEGEKDSQSLSNYLLESGPNFLPTRSVQVFPNPIRDGYDLTIRPDNGIEYEHVYVFNLEGKLLGEQSIDAGTTELLLPSSMLQNGVNMIVLTRADGGVFVDRIIKE